MSESQEYIALMKMFEEAENSDKEKGVDIIAQPTSSTSDDSILSALQQALDDGQEVKIFKLLGCGPGYCVVIHGDCYVEAMSRDTLDQAITDAAKLYQSMLNESE